MATQFQMTRGDSKLLRLPILDTTSGEPINLTGAKSVKWGLAKRVHGEVLVSKAIGDGIQITSPANGIIEITLDPTDTANLSPGEYYHEAQIIDAQDAVATVIGDRCLILPDLLTGD